MANTTYTVNDKVTDAIQPLTTSAREEETLPGIISEATLRMLETVVNAGILPVLVLCGVTGNVINVAVFVRQGLSDRINLCLFSLAISDCGFLLSHLLSRIYVLFYLFSSALGDVFKTHWVYFIGLYHAFISTSNSLLLVISVERYICVISPLRAKTLFSARMTASVVITLFVVNFAGKGISSFKYKVEEITDPNTNATVLQSVTTEFYLNNRLYLYGTVEVALNVILPTVSLFIVIATTVVIAVRMRSVLSWRKEKAHVSATNSTSSTNQREAALTRMLMVVCLVYTLCTAPTVVEAITRVFVADFVAGGRYNNIFFASLFISHLFESVNCSINFIIYYTMSTRFRETLRDMVHRKDAKKKKKQVESNTRVSVLSAFESCTAE